ncbi:hypothetical protein JKF63_01780 [Porcisia hertigi]|uniref:DoxX family protein n=1 Tax=Porcisia hertigi TaxID=2761500 RepID=A0A836IGE5_9TRYP|nr:hypothetical protein JKF63_01780 [Porcisia hertigi]
MLRNLIRYTGLTLVLLIFIVSGIDKLAAPSVSAAHLAKSNFPRMIAVMGIKLSPAEYVHLIRATGVLFVSSSLFILLGVGRTFFSLLMALSMMITTLAFYVDFDEPLASSEENLQNLLKNLSMVGALLFVSGSGQRSRRYTQAYAARDTDRAKKSN